MHIVYYKTIKDAERYPQVDAVVAARRALSTQTNCYQRALRTSKLPKNSTNATKTMVPPVARSKLNEMSKPLTTEISAKHSASNNVRKKLWRHCIAASTGMTISAPISKAPTI